MSANAKHVKSAELAALGDRLRDSGRIIVWTNGCFDLFHIGHLRSLEAAKAFGDVLIVGLNSDACIERLKGPNRPILPADERVELMSALACVDYVTVFVEDTPELCLKLLKPHVHCKGADYAPPHGKAIPEQALVESYGGRVEFLPMIAGRSTTSLIRRIQSLPDS